MHPTGRPSGQMPTAAIRALDKEEPTMRDSSTVPFAGPVDANAHRPLRGDPSTINGSAVVLAAVVGIGTTAWQHAVLTPGIGTVTGHLPYLAVDAMLAVPAAAAAIWFVAAIR